ncbi:hypothetical protein GCM10007874_10490 [Labrys miyagiensis]|uniref:Uncharacterized protein n=1 Tax=Labrys miyagiensis TaxID=346912 RepID=A0ABQ6CCD7_9HYPH|nr:hypothetical protein GCM10007874_10490 [Labrys miyagiensis]
MPKISDAFTGRAFGYQLIGRIGPHRWPNCPFAPLFEIDANRTEAIEAEQGAVRSACEQAPSDMSGAATAIVTKRRRITGRHHCTA